MIFLFVLEITNIRLNASDADVIENAERGVVRIEVQSSEGNSQGSGFVVDESGLVITNCHVIANAQSAKAIFPSGQTASIIGIRWIDERKDIAVIDLAPASYSKLSLSPDLPRKGDAVIALGSPVGLSFTVTRGIVSGIRSAGEMRREVDIENAEGTWVQVDAALSPGNSGGPLISSEGLVVAMSTLASSGPVQNVNFGIASRDIEQAIQLARQKPRLPLSTGSKVAPTKSASRRGPAGSNGPPPVAGASIEEFIHRFTRDFSKYKRDLGPRISSLKSSLRDAKSGEIEPRFAQGTARGVAVRDQVVSGRKKRRYFFADTKSKQGEISRLEDLIHRLENANSASPDKFDDRFCLLAEFAGPKLNVRSFDQVGTLPELTVEAIAGSRGVVFELDGNPYLLVLDSMAGIFEGSVLEPSLGIVRAAVQIEVPNRGTLNLTVLQQVSSSRFREIANNSDPSATASQANEEETLITSNDFGSDLLGDRPASVTQRSDGQFFSGVREWNDRSGKFSVHAKLLSSTATKVTLKKEDGKVIQVEISKLSDADQIYLKQNR